MRRIAAILSTVLLPAALLFVPATATAAPEAPAATAAAAAPKSYFGADPKAIAKKLGLKPDGKVKARKGVKQLATDAAIITTYPSKKLQAKAEKATQKIATETGATLHAVRAKGTLILVLDNLPETASALAGELPGAKVKSFAP